VVVQEADWTQSSGYRFLYFFLLKCLKYKIAIEPFFFFFTGFWMHIVLFLNVVGITNNAFLIAYVSVWAQSTLFSSNEVYKLIFVIAFEVNIDVNKI
jgi:hypothetical protein